MIKKQFRLTKQKDFDQAFKGGKSFYVGCLGARVAANNLGVNRYGIVIGNKISKKAVDRNRIKRRLRAILKEESTKIKSGMDVVIICLTGTASVEYKTLKETISKIFERFKLYL